MKKLVLTAVCALATAGAAFAQGTVTWNTIVPTAMSAQTNSTVYSPLFGGGSTGAGAIGATALGTAGASYYYELLYTSFSGTQATISSLSSLLAWNDSGLEATNNASGTAGRVSVINPSTQAVVPWAAGTTDSIVLVGWSADLGSTWGVVSNELATGTFGTVLAGQEGFLGVSTTGYTATGSGNPGAAVFGAVTAQGLPIVSVNTQLFLLPVPEPTTLALAGLGGLSLLLFRRQRK